MWNNCIDNETELNEEVINLGLFPIKNKKITETEEADD